MNRPLGWFLDGSRLRCQSALLRRDQRLGRLPSAPRAEVLLSEEVLEAGVEAVFAAV
jgi:hypothetical protein